MPNAASHDRWPYYDKSSRDEVQEAAARATPRPVSSTCPPGRPSPAATRYRVTFERVGRDHFVPPLEVEADDGDALAHHIHAYAGRFLGSKDYEVIVNGDHGSIGWGRLGLFTVEVVA